jgi:hypothetical protein
LKQSQNQLKVPPKYEGIYMSLSRLFKPLLAAGLATIATTKNRTPVRANEPHYRYWTKDGLPTPREKQCKERLDMFFSKDPAAINEFLKCLKEAEWKDKDDYVGLIADRKASSK